jgi:PAS domain S-box-containing protein
VSRIQSEFELEPGEERFHRLLDALPTAAYTCDPDGLITYFNARAAELWGRRPKVKDPADRYCGSFKLFATDGSPIRHDQCGMALALRYDRPYPAEEIVIERPDGSRVNVLSHASPIHMRGNAAGHTRGKTTGHADGKTTGAVNILESFTMNEQAHAASLRLAAIVDSSTDAIASKDLHGIVRTWNRGAELMFGYSAAEIIGKPITTIIPIDRRAEEVDVLARIHRGESVNHFETVRQRKDGTLVDISLNVSPIRDDSGVVIGASKIARDITEQKRLQAVLSESDRCKDEFLALLAHELRNPLAPIANALQLVRLARDDPATLERAHGVIDRQLQHLVRLVDDLMDESRLTRNRLALRTERIDLALAVRSAIECTRAAIEAAHHELVVQLPADPIYVDADLVRLAQVFSNLLSNATKYTERGGRILVTATRASGQAVVRVRDTGIGIPAAMRERIFEMFVQVDGSLERSQTGLGIGLSLVRALVELHGGSVEALSDGPGRGSELVVRLPAVSCAPNEDTHADHANAELRSKGGSRVLVVDDNVDSATMLSMILSLRGYDVRTAHDGVEAFEIATAFRPHVAFMDIGLPRLNGYDVARKLRQHPSGANMFLIAVTGWGQADDKRRAREAGFDDHIVKPIDHRRVDELLVEHASASRPRP